MRCWLRSGWRTSRSRACSACHRGARRVCISRCLQPDGSDKADVEHPKLIIGQGSAGFPICLAPPNDLLGLAITEGVEDALSVHQATGLGAWAAGSAGRMPALAAHVPAYVDCVTIAAHSDPDGEKGALDLAAALEVRGVEVNIQGLF